MIDRLDGLDAPGAGERERDIFVQFLLRQQAVAARPFDLFGPAGLAWRLWH
tara:strand:- start:10794 stop:10946 length:153 start_codon:yes stop_codon:yes gene_type:complete